MRWLMTISLLGLLVALTHAGDDKKDLAVYESNEGRYKAMLGEEPRIEKKAVNTEAGKLTIHSATVNLNRDLTLAVSWTDYPESFRTVPQDKLLTAVREGMKAKASRTTETPIPATDPNPAGTEMLVEYGRNCLRTRLYLVNNRLYQVSATGKKDMVESRTAGKFLASFEVLK